MPRNRDIKDAAGRIQGSGPVARPGDAAQDGNQHLRSTSSPAELNRPHTNNASRQSLEIYSRLAMTDAQREYNEVIGRFPV